MNKGGSEAKHSPGTRSEAGERRASGRSSGSRAAHDLVESIFLQWKAERPDIDPKPVRIYGLIAQIHLQSTAFINEALAPLDLVRGTFDVLTALRRVGDPYALTPKQLAAQLLLSGAGLTSRLNQLESRQLIARLPEPSDRRTVRIQLTASGESLVNQAIPIVFQAQWRRMIPLGEESAERLADELKRFAEAITASADPAGGGETSSDQLFVKKRRSGSRQG